MEVEINGLVANRVWGQVEHAVDKFVMGTKIPFKRNIGQNGEVEKYKCRTMAQIFR